jgi:putative protease
MTVLRALPRGKTGHSGELMGLWLSPAIFKAVSRTLCSRIAWWLPPVLWPEEEAPYRELVARLQRRGARHFVCNAPWQAGLFEQGQGLHLTAGPFCNTANALALAALQRLGFAAAVVSPELGREEFLALPGQSPIPLGIVLRGAWPAGLSRYRDLAAKTQLPLASPKHELFWTQSYGQNLWIYPGWPLDLSPQSQELEDAGYSLFITLDEPRPETLPAAHRSSPFNWELDLL